MNRRIAKVYTDEEIIADLTSGGYKIDDYYIEEDCSGSYSVAVFFNGQHFDLIWEDDSLHAAVLAFLQKRGARIVPYND